MDYSCKFKCFQTSAAWHKATWLFYLLLMLALQTHAASIQITVTDQQGKHMEHAVVTFFNTNANRTDAVHPPTAIMDQKDKQFVPHVLPVQLGTLVRFPNSDDVRHQVYSFSEPKPFKLPLYHGEPAEPIIFDKPGKVVLGCNIHDRMLGYIYIVDTPYFTKTSDSGIAVLEDIPTGNYQVKIWHPNLEHEYVNEQVLTIDKDQNISYSLNIMPEASIPQERELTPLEKKFRQIGKK